MKGQSAYKIENGLECLGKMKFFENFNNKTTSLVARQTRTIVIGGCDSKRGG
jgi:hypothetical protein